MRVLVVHGRYRERGGEDEVYEAETELLERGGHEVHRLERHNDDVDPSRAVGLAARTVWNREVGAEVRETLRSSRFDLVHVHNTLPLLSPAVHRAARAEGVPVVQTLHNYRLLCPSAVLYRDARLCEDCAGRAFAWPGILHACYRGSRVATAAVAAATAFHDAIGTWRTCVSAYIALTEFSRRKFAEFGLPLERIAVKPNFVAPDPGPGAGEGGFVLFAGRLSVEKGVRTLLRALERLRGEVPGLLIGDGPLAPEVRAAVERLPHVRWLGRRPLEEVVRRMGHAAAVIVPSEWYETFGRVVIESYARGTPVIASRIGALEELVEDGRTGWLFPPGDAPGLEARIRLAHRAAGRGSPHRVRARAAFERSFTAAANYERLLEIYRSVTESAAGSPRRKRDRAALRSGPTAGVARGPRRGREPRRRGPPRPR